MSEEKKASENEAAVSGYFDSLIEDFNTDKSEDGPKPDVSIDPENPPKDIRDFSKFFDDATAFGSGFQSTIDKLPDEISDGSEENVSFSETENRDIITEPVTDEDGMIVIFDEEAGIDATTAKHSEDNSRVNNPEDSPVNASEDNFEPDSNISEEQKKAPEKAEKTVPEKAAVLTGEAENSSVQKPVKRSFIQGILPWKGDSIAEVIRKLVFIASTGVFIAAGIMLISTLVQSEEMQEEAESIAEMVTTTVATTVNESGETITIPPTTEERIQHNESVMDSFIRLSSNVKGFIELAGCNIYLPVVQGTDNSYYLTHTYDDRKNKAGAIFMDYRCTLEEDYTSPNIVLYGHNQEDGTMFGNLKKYKNNVDFYKKNPIVVFNSEYGIGDYIIFGYFVTNVYENQDSNGEVFHYHDYIETLNNEVTFKWYMEQVNERNQIIPPVDVAFGDKLLVLSTCSNEFSDSRFVVLARKVREGEDISSINFSAARLNPYAKQIDWSAILSDSDTGSITIPITPKEINDCYNVISQFGLSSILESARNSSDDDDTADNEIIPEDTASSESESESESESKTQSDTQSEVTEVTTVTEQTTVPDSSDSSASDSSDDTASDVSTEASSEESSSDTESDTSSDTDAAVSGEQPDTAESVSET